MAKRNDIVPYERPQARKWTRVSDYVPEGEAFVGGVHWPGPTTVRALDNAAGAARRRSALGFLLPIAAIAIAAILSLWGSGAFSPEERHTAAGATSRGIVFGLCTAGGLTNCVASGDSFYLNGKTVRIAGIDAPNPYGATCERELGTKASLHLQSLLNSGALRLTRTDQDLDRFGLLLRNVAVDGKDVATAMIDAGMARETGDAGGAWC